MRTNHLRIFYLLGAGFLLPFFLQGQSVKSKIPLARVPGRLIVHHAGSPSDPSALRAVRMHGGRVHAETRDGVLKLSFTIPAISRAEPFGFNP